MKKLSLLFALSFLLVLVSCNKDQQAVKMLDGSWEEVAINGDAVPDSSKGKYTFESCKLKSEEFCNAFYTDSDGGVTDYTFSVGEKGTTLSFKIEDPTFGAIQITSAIVELTDSKLILNLSFFGQTTETEYKKI